MLGFSDAEDEMSLENYRLGVLQAEFLIANGLKPHHKLIDIGADCRHNGVIAACLDVGNYYATDIDEDHDFSWVPDTVRFNFAFALSLFTQMPPDYIRLCLKTLHPVMAQGGVLFATGNHSDEIASAYDGLPWRMTPIGDWGHPRGQQMFRLAKHDDPER